MGPSAYRAAGLAGVLADLGHEVIDFGDVTLATSPAFGRTVTHANPAVKGLSETLAWAEVLSEVAYRVSADCLPLFLGGDHSLALGTVPGIARRAAERGRPLFLIWLDAHTDYHTLETTVSGNLHGIPMAYVTGRSGFEGTFPPMLHPIAPHRVGMIGIRSVDAAERAAIAASGIAVHDMRAMDEEGVVPFLRAFLDRVTAENGLLHVSLDVDFLEPDIAPGVGTTVPGGATFREAHLIMEILHDSGVVSSLDLVELNPFLDERGRTAFLMVDLAASLLGRRVLDRPTRSYV
jgi:arginase